ncbi:RHS repeat-associated core domain-containing protein [Dactylosporangium sp. NPDC051541]|uniref:RHS repeat-associated core domain-containing protein n=1 Tax=Dactylosporangium sp. NPDC051541 TaxID=3363977 RepID=UPI00378D0959
MSTLKIVAVRLLCVALVVTPAAVARPAAAAPPSALLPTQTDRPIPGVPLAAQSRPADPAVAAAARTAARAAPVWPAASAADVRAESIGPAAPGLRLTVLDQQAAGAAGVHGTLIRLDRADSAAATVPGRVSIDYAKFATGYGADWTNRLRLLRLPACALTTPAAKGCTDGTVLTSTNDVKAGRISAAVAVPQGGAVVALSAGPAGGSGDFAATSLAPASTWSAGANAGDFSWSYPIQVPPSLGGPAPDIALSYSSQSVDGRNAATNNQPSWIGEGFEWSPGAIERRYKPCSDDMDGVGHNNTTRTGDLCYETDNATLALDGHSGELLKDAANPDRWHLRRDDGTLVLHKTGAGNGAKDGEWWLVVTPDGTQYHFGATPAANSTLTVPVYGNDTGEPCRQATFAASSCVQAYKWSVDRVVDTHANTMSYSYRKETNAYARNNSTTDLATYDRAGYLETIRYGTRDTDTGAAPVQVSFAVADRCVTANCGTHDGVNWPDTPWDQQCTAAPCLIGSPTFWTTKRLTSVTTRIWDPAAAPPGYRDVDAYTLTQTFPDPGDGTRAGLWLARISHTGLAGAATTVPDTQFSGVQLRNRVDTLTDGKLPMNWWRIARIDTESGGAIRVAYSEPDCVPGSRMPDVSAPQNNTLRCYPVKVLDAGSTTPRDDFFHKYVVTETREGDLVGGAPDVVHAYEYVGAPAWHYTDDDGLTKAQFKTWSVWRGYEAVRVRTGDPARTTPTYTETRYFRGMHGDHLPGGSRTVTQPAVDVNRNGSTADAGVDAPAVADEDAYAGLTRMSITFNGVGGPEVSATVSEPWRSAPTASRTINQSTVEARFTDIEATHTRTTLDTDGGRRAAGTRTTSSRSSFDGFGMTVEVDDRGDDAAGGDETCTITTYARNTDVAAGTWLTAPVARTQTFATGCATAKAGGLGEADVIGDTRTAYDGRPFGGPPTKGDVTEAQELRTYSATGPTYITVSRTGYDLYGRVTDAWDVDGDHITSGFTPATGGPVTQTTTTNALGWTTTTTLDPARGRPVSTVDVNGRRTDVAYDGLGRTSAVWQPGASRAAGQPASTTFTYTVRTGGANAITTNTLNAAGGYVTSVVLYDGLLRPRQTQVADASVAGARVVTDTLYDSAGRAWKTTRAYPMTGPPGTDVSVPRPPDYSGPEEIPAWTESVFDGAGREIASVFKARDVERWRTTTAYTGDRTDVTTPAGGSATSTITDALGHTVALRQFAANTPTGSFDTTTYTYNRKDQLTGVTDPRGTRWSYVYDLRGRQTQIDDPDKGRTTRGYDDAGRVVSETRAGDTLAYTYDALGRKTSLRNGSATGSKRAEWVYDTVTAGTGLLSKSIRYDGSGNAYTYEVLGYNPAKQPTSVRYGLPPGETGFGATSFTYVYTYNADGSPASTRTPAAADLGTENLTFGYNALGRPTTLSTNLGGTLVTSTGYTNYGETNVVTLRNNSGGIVQIGDYYETDTRRLHEIKTSTAVQPATIYADLVYSYSDAGDVTRLADTVSRDTQCFGYDGRRRLTEAWTPESGDCAAARTVDSLGGPARYWQSWTFDAAGDRLTQTGHATTNTTATYTYPAAAGPRPHGVTSIAYTGATTGTDAYTYDAAGRTAGRPGQTLTWDAEDHLATLADSTGSTAYLYDADGNRLVRRDPDGKTLYLPGQEIRFTTATGTARTTRSYSYAGGVIATRGGAGLTWLSGDHQGTASLAVAATTQAASVRRFTPYGMPRGTISGAWPPAMDKGFVGGTVDNTGLTHLGAREYDPALGRFISADPVFDAKDPQSWQGYAYAGNTPVTASDASGLTACLRIEDPSGPCASQLKTAAGQRRLDEVVRAEAKRQAYWTKFHRDLNTFNRRTGEDRERVTKPAPKPMPVIVNSHTSGCGGWGSLACAAGQALRGPARGPDQDKDKGAGCPWWTGLSCAAMQIAGRGTVAGCGNVGGVAAAWGWSAEICVGMDKDGMFIEATKADKGSIFGGLFGAGLGYQVSTAETAEGLSGPFYFATVDGGEAGATLATDGKVIAYSAGVGASAPLGLAVGRSETGVVRYGFCGGLIGVCLGPPGE